MTDPVTQTPLSVGRFPAGTKRLPRGPRGHACVRGHLRRCGLGINAFGVGPWKADKWPPEMFWDSYSRGQQRANAAPTPSIGASTRSGSCQRGTQ